MLAFQSCPTADLLTSGMSHAIGTHIVQQWVKDKMKLPLGLDSAAAK